MKTMDFSLTWDCLHGKLSEWEHKKIYIVVYSCWTFLSTFMPCLPAENLLHGMETEEDLGCQCGDGKKEPNTKGLQEIRDFP